MMGATVETLTESAVLPRPKCAITLLKPPLEHAATQITSTSTFGGKSSINVANHVPTGSKMNCRIKPQITALGVFATRRKSSTFNSNATEKSISARTTLRAIYWVVTKVPHKLFMPKYRRVSVVMPQAIAKPYACHAK
jgi:hypothetical protein